MSPLPGPQQQLFRKGSRTYFFSSLFFPPAVRREVTILYGFVRKADDFVDSTPARPDEFFAFRRQYELSRDGLPSGNPIIDDFVELAQRKKFDPAWAESFFDAMQSDLAPRPYETLGQLLNYIWGSAEVIGLYLCQILDLPPEARSAACRLGRSMQYINFLRDIAEDCALGRRYLPLEGTSLATLTRETAQAEPEQFAAFFRSQAQLYRTWQEEAAAGYGWIPRRYLIAIKTASDLYNWTARVLQKKPHLVWRRKVKPSLLRVLLTALGNLFYIPRPPCRLAGEVPA